MKASKTVLIALCFVLLNFISIDAFAKDNVSQAKEFIQAGMYPQAIAVLEKEIYGDEKAKAKANPVNAEAQFLLGVCYANQGRYNDADKRFASTVKLKSNYGYKIGGAYKDAGMSSLENGDFESTQMLFDKALKYQPDLRRTIATALLNQGKRSNIDRLLSLAVDYDRGLRGEVSSYYYDLSKSSSGDEGLTALKKADEYNGGAYKAEAGNKAIEVCDSKSRPEDRKTCIDRNSEYLSAEQIFESSVRFYTNLWGPPTKVVRLERSGEWEFIADVKDGDRIDYLSLEDFQRKDGESVKVWKSAVSEKYGYRFMNGTDTSIWFGKNLNNTNVYVWKRH